ncbi:MAG: hypothetical protein ACRCTX_27540, partial [Afipia sp.]
MIVRTATSQTKDFAKQKAAIFQIFSEVDSASTNFTERLLSLGVGGRATARPLALDWASGKYDVPLTPGQRGVKFCTDA